MTNKETITRNIGLTFDFVNHLTDNPDLMDNLPDNFKLNFVESDFSIIIKNDMQKNDLKEKYVKVVNNFDFGKA